VRRPGAGVAQLGGVGLLGAPPLGDVDVRDEVAGGVELVGARGPHLQHALEASHAGLVGHSVVVGSRLPVPAVAAVGAPEDGRHRKQDQRCEQDICGHGSTIRPLSIE
jgi:hypothetical protein